MARSSGPVCTFKAAIHEAGHAIIALSCRQKIHSVWARDDKGACELSPSLPRVVYHACDVSVRGARRDLMFDVAGWLAEDLHTRAQTGKRKTKCKLAEDNRISHERNHISYHLRHADDDGASSEGGDEWHAAQLARRIVEHERMIEARPLVVTRSINNADIVAEIERAEAAAERILKRRWDEVIAVATAIFRRKSGRLTGKQVAQTIRLCPQRKATAKETATKKPRRSGRRRNLLE